jgi:hypothetical protein
VNQIRNSTPEGHTPHTIIGSLTNKNNKTPEGVDEVIVGWPKI